MKRAAIYLRSFLVVWLFVAPFTVFMSVITILMALTRNPSYVDHSIAFWAKRLLEAFGVSVVMEGLENLPDERGALLLFNHQSHFDILALHGHFPKRLRFGAKIELFKIPFFGAAMRLSGTLPIVRENRAETFRVYKDASEKFAANWTFALAPEGTRQHQPVIGRFKRGPFIFAVGASAPIVPTVIDGAYDVLPKSNLIANKDRWRRVIRVRFLPVIETQCFKESDTAALAEKTRALMEAAFLEMRSNQSSSSIAPRAIS